MNRQQNPLRKLVKLFYVLRVLRHVQGPSLEAGCGAGQILARLPPGLVRVAKNRFMTLVLSHVLEHIDRADQVRRQLLRDCAQLGISNVVMVVPGGTGYWSDPTPKTFVTMGYLESHQLLACKGFKLAHHA
jgi:hypothetical protein